MASELSPLGDLVRRHDPDRFLCALFAPPARRETLFLLCAFNHELARAGEVASEPLLALIRLQWWREVVEGARRRHPVAGPLRTALEDGALSAEDLLAMIEGREAETEAPLADLAAVLAHAERTAGALAAAAGRLLGADAAQRERLRLLGAAYGLAGLLRSRPARARQGRPLLPEGVASAEIVAAGRVRLAAAAGPMPRALIAPALLAPLARRDLARGGDPGPRGLGDRLAVVAAWLRARV